LFDGSVNRLVKNNVVRNISKRKEVKIHSTMV